MCMACPMRMRCPTRHTTPIVAMTTQQDAIFITPFLHRPTSGHLINDLCTAMKRLWLRRSDDHLSGKSDTITNGGPFFRAANDVDNISVPGWGTSTFSPCRVLCRSPRPFKRNKNVIVLQGRNQDNPRLSGYPALPLMFDTIFVSTEIALCGLREDSISSQMLKPTLSYHRKSIPIFGGKS